MDAPDIKAYPFQFDPSQFANPYTQWNKQALPFMGQYAGAPTDARGNPIQSYQDALAAQKAAQTAATAAPPAQGTTLNSSGPPLGSPAPIPQYIQTQGGTASGGQASVNAGLQGGQWVPGQMVPNPAYTAAQQQRPTAAAAPAAPAGPDMNAAYLQALANPGKVTTPGATVAQSAPPSAQSGVLQQFLANWQKQGSPTTGAGNYNNKDFYAALQGMV